MSPEIIIPDGEADMFVVIAGNTEQDEKARLARLFRGLRTWRG